MTDEEPLEINFPDVVHINVGGIRLTTTLGTVRKYPESRLCKMFNGQIHIISDEEGVFCIDRDGRYFHHILNFLRDGSPPLGLSKDMRLELLRETRFYGLRRLHEVVGGTQDPRDLGCSSEPVVPAVKAQYPGPDLLSPRHCQRLPTETGSAWSHSKSSRYGGSGGSTELFPSTPCDTVYVRLRYGNEYSGDWIVSSPRNLPGVEYELHDACLAREPIAAMNKMTRAGFVPCDYPPRVPPVSDFNTDKWSIMMYRITRRWEASRELQQNGDAGRYSTVVTPPAGSGAVAARANAGNADLLGLRSGSGTLTELLGIRSGSGSLQELLGMRTGSTTPTDASASRANAGTPPDSAPRAPLRRMQAWRTGL